MDVKEAISKLDMEGEPEGFFGLLRAGFFDQEKLQKVIMFFKQLR